MRSCTSLSCWSIALASLLAIAPVPAAPLFVVTEPWVRVASSGGSAEAFMQLRSSEGATLIAARSDASSGVVLRSPGTKGAIVERIALPAGTTVILAPGGYRVDLPRLDRALTPGDRVVLVLTIEATDGTRQDVPTNAEVRLHSPTEDHLRPHKH